MGILGVFVIFYLLRHAMGEESEEHSAARAMQAVLEHQAKQNTAELHQQAADQGVSPAQLLVPPAPVATAPTAVAPTGHPIQLPTVPTPQGPATPAASPAPFPAAIPASVPTFPAGWAGGNPPGWHYASTVTPAMSARAQALFPQLWATGAGTHTTEMTGGTWVTYNAEMVAGGKKGVTAYVQA